MGDTILDSSEFETGTGRVFAAVLRRDIIDTFVRDSILDQSEFESGT